MFNPEQRRATLATFPAGTPLLVLAATRTGFAELVAERNDPATAFADLETVVAGTGFIHATVGNVIIEGLDDLDEPGIFLAGLSGRLPQARIFALVANGAHLVALGAFFAGVPLAAGHPIVRDEIDSLFGQANWRIVAIKPIRDESLPAAEALPFAANIGPIVFALSDSAMLARSRDAGFLVIADPA
jgi:hypothetical protein